MFARTVPALAVPEGVLLYVLHQTVDHDLLAARDLETGDEVVVDVVLRKAASLPDGSGFLFMGGTADTDWQAGLPTYDMQDGCVSCG